MLVFSAALARCVVAVVAVFGMAGPAAASPIVMYFDSGSAHITANRTSDNSLVTDTDISLDGLSVTFDPATPEIVSFAITAPMSAPISLLQPWGGFDTFVIESASIVPGGGYSSIFVSMTGPTTYAFLVGPVDVNGIYSAFNSGGPPPVPVSNVPVPFIGASFLNGTIDTDLMLLELLGITLAEIPGAAFGEIDNLVVKADITWSGSIIPEPSTATLLSLGIVGLAALRGRNSSVS